jgi:hypothetical protein
MKLVKYLIVVFSLIVAKTNAQYVTIGAGSWNNPGIWNLGSVPTSASGSITVNHNVSIPSGYSLTIDETTVNATLTVASGGLLTLADGTGVDLTMNASSSLIVNGEVIRNNLSTITQNVTSIASFNAGSIYRHRYQTTEGVPPTATWSATSNFFIEGFANTSTLDLTSSAWIQTFGNFTYNCSGQKAIVSFNGLVTNIQGNLTFQSTGNNLVRITDNEVNVTISVAGNLSILGTSRVDFSEDGTGGVLNLAGDFNHTSTSTLGSILTNNGSFTANITGDFIMNAGAGRLFMASSAGATGVSTLNLHKNFTLTSGTITESGSGNANGNIRFIGNGSFTFTNSGSILNWINYYIASTVTLDLGTSPIASGTGSTFTLDQGTIICGSLEPTGAIRTTTTLGNIRTPNVGRNYVSGSTIIYRSSSAQFMGDGQPSAAGITTIIDNAQGVTLYQGSVATLTIGGTLQLKTGILSIGARTLSLTGNVTYNAGSFGGTSSSVLLIGGSSGGSFGALNFDPSNNVLGTLTLNRTGGGASVDVNATLIISSQLNLTNGSLNNNSGLTAGNGCVVSRYPTAFLLVNRLSHAVTDLYDVSYKTASTAGTFVTYSTALELPLSTDATALNNLTIGTAQTADVVNLAQDVTVNGNVSLNKGSFGANSFTITMKGSSWSDNAGTFVPGTGLVKFSGNTTVAGTGTPLFGNIQLIAGSTLSIGKNSNISGNVDFQSGATFNPSTFTITLNGAALQTVSPNGADFFNVTVAKSGGNVQLASSMDLLSILKFSNPSANCSFQSNGFLTLISSSDSLGTATIPHQGQIYRLSGGNNISGDVTVQRYMSGEGRIYRYLSSPITNATVASWQDDFAITGTFSNPSSGQTICGTKLIPSTPSLYYYNETIAGAVNTGYVAYPTSGTAASNSLIAGRGYASFIRQCISPTVVDVTGPVNQGNFTYSVTYTNTGNAAADGYNLVGNPYPCTIDWDMGFTKTRISNVISITDNGTGVVLYWDGTTGGIPNGQIAVGQAFWVRATAANPILRIIETSKAIAPEQAAEFFRQAAPDVATISLSDGVITDKTYIKVRSMSKNSLDDWDAPKLDNAKFDLYTLSEDGIQMAINSLHDVSCQSTFVLGIKDMEKKTYTLSLAEELGIFDQYSFRLKDNYTNQTFSFNSPYQFSVDDNALSASADRFELELGPKIQAAPLDISYENILCKNNDASIQLNATTNGVTYQVTDSTDQLLSSVSGDGGAGSIKVLAKDLKTGINTYKVKSISSCNTIYETKEIQIEVEETPKNFTVNSASNCGQGQVSLKATGVPAGYIVNWFASLASQEVLFTGAIFQTPSIDKTSTYYASIESVHGCISSRLIATAEIINIDEPVITVLDANTLTVNSSEGIQWYFNNNLIEGAVNPDLVADKSGTYSVTVTTSGCPVTSELEFLVTGNDEIQTSEIIVYPMPVDRYLYVKNKILTTNDILLIDNLGRVKSANAFREGESISVDMAGFSSGIYYLQALLKGKPYRYKVIKK